jgi:hypothetical protein
LLNYLIYLRFFVVIVIIDIIFNFRRVVVGPKKGTPISAKGASTPVSSKSSVSRSNKRRRQLADDISDNDNEDDAETSPATKKRKINKHGLITLQNGVVSMKGLDLADAVPSKYRDDEAPPLLGAKLSFGQAYALFTLVKCGHQAPVEKVRDQESRMQIVFSAQPYCISEDQLLEITSAQLVERQAFVQGMSKAALQKLRYNLYGAVGNLFNERVFTKPEVQPYELVRIHLGLKGLVPERSVMDM